MAPKKWRCRATCRLSSIHPSGAAGERLSERNGTARYRRNGQNAGEIAGGDRRRPRVDQQLEAGRGEQLNTSQANLKLAPDYGRTATTICFRTDSVAKQDVDNGGTGGRRRASATVKSAQAKRFAVGTGGGV